MKILPWMFSDKEVSNKFWKSSGCESWFGLLVRIEFALTEVCALSVSFLRYFRWLRYVKTVRIFAIIRFTGVSGQKPFRLKGDYSVIWMIRQKTSLAWQRRLDRTKGQHSNTNSGESWSIVTKVLPSFRLCIRSESDRQRFCSANMECTAWRRCFWAVTINIPAST